MNKILVPNATSFGLFRTLKQKFYVRNASTSNVEKFFDGNIPEDKFKKTFIRSSGPGGQHVNMKNSKAVIKLKTDDLDWLHPQIKKKFLEKHKNLVSNNNIIALSADTTRSPIDNLKECFDKLRDMLFECQREILEGPRPPNQEEEDMLKARLERSNRRRLREKKKASINKKIGSEIFY